MMPGYRPATPAERAEDYRKREAALDGAEEHGFISKRQAERRRAELEEFRGYPRPEGEVPKVMRPPKGTGGVTPGWQRFRIDPEMLAPTVSAITKRLTDEYLSQILAVEEQMAVAAVRFGCAYAVIRRDNFEQNEIVYEYLLLPDVHELRKLDFPSWDAFNAWQERGRPL